MRILAATDGSEAADRAVEYAASLTKLLGGSLTVVHVVPLRDIPLVQLDAYKQTGVVTRPEAMTEASRDTLKRARQRVEALSVGAVRCESAIELHEGNIGETIIEAARRHEADAIVLGKRGVGRLSALVLGSVSQKVVELASRPVVVVP